MKIKPTSRRQFAAIAIAAATAAVVGSHICVYSYGVSCGAENAMSYVNAKITNQEPTPMQDLAPIGVLSAVWTIASFTLAATNAAAWHALSRHDSETTPEPDTEEPFEAPAEP